MKQFNDYLLPDVGKCFKLNNVITFKIDSDSVDYEELEINPENVEVMGELAFVDRKFAVSGKDYRELKTNLVKKLFSNDDQIAIILNKEKTVMTYMNQWRDWFGTVAHKIIELRNV